MSQRLLPLFRSIYESQSEIADARRAITGNPDLEARLEDQTRFDDQIVTELHAIAMTDEQIEQLENLLAEGPEPGAPAETLLEPELPLDSVTARVASKPEDRSIVAPPTPVVPPPPPEPAHKPSPVAATARSVVPGQPAPQLSELRKETPADQPTPESKTEEEEEEKEAEPPRARTVTILTAVSVGIIATIAMIAYMVWDQMNSFSGADQVAELLNSANSLTGDEFDPVPKTTATAALKDWFFLKSEMRWFAIPKEFADTPALGCRVFKFKGADIAQILTRGDKDLVLMFLFHPADLGVRVKKGKWTIVDGENWVGGVTAVEDCCFVVAFKGKHSDMQDYLDKKIKK
jgi:hypothetical protein